MANRSSKDATIEELAEKVRYHRNLYYNQQPEISDAEFDALEDELRARAPNHAVLAEVGAAPSSGKVIEPEKLGKKQSYSKEVERLAAEVEKLSDSFYDEAPDRAYKQLVKDYRAAWEKLSALAGDHPALTLVVPAEGSDWPKARHEIPMGSLNKVNAHEELREWSTRCDELAKKAELPPITPDLSVTEKLDGLSLEVLYQDGKLEAAITRGDGEIGELITANVAHMKHVPGKIKNKARISVRGEIILSKKDGPGFHAFRKRLDSEFGEMKSLRNMAAGIARAKEVRYLPACRYLSVLFYDLEGGPAVTSEKEKLEFLVEQGFTTPAIDFGDLDAILARFDEYQGGLRKKIDYEIDGLVVRANDLRTQTLLGELNNRPRAAVAFKFTNEAQETTLLNILWSTGDSGRITPIAQIEKVFLAGAEVKQASLHNIANVRRLGIGVGDRVLVSRRNDVIPYVEERVEQLAEKLAEPPEKCGRCEQPVIVEGEYLVCRNLDCPARRVGRLRMWIRELGLLDWGERTLERFFEEGLAQEPADLYRLTVEQITALSGYGEATAKKLLDPLAEKRKLPLAVFIGALGIEGVARETAKLLVNAGYDSPEKIAAATIDDLSQIPGLGAIKAERIINGLKGRLEEIGRLREAGVVIVTPKEGGPLAGLSFCFSGSHSRGRKELQALIEKNGGSVAASVTKGVSYLVLADPSSTSSKSEKAKKLGTEVIDEAQMDAIITERGGALS